MEIFGELHHSMETNISLIVQTMLTQMVDYLHLQQILLIQHQLPSIFLIGVMAKIIRIRDQIYPKHFIFIRILEHLP